jgi:hypothetical protein
MRIPQSSLEAFSAGPIPLPPPVEPRLTLAEEVVLLSLYAPRRVIRHVVRVAGKAHPDGPRRYDAARRRLTERGLLDDHGAATPQASLQAREARVRAIIRRAAPPEGRDAELLTLLAATGSLPLEGRADHLHARTRLASISDPPPAVGALADELALDLADLAERLLPAPRDVASGFEFGSSAYPALWS